ncbi:hypothetical protein [Actinophytocola oryzae]|uniref:Uncharacterized protein n=1 Tax=Actinophytocola oryzae TaxID=502181 RepID=A0A4R7UWM4_9PSEU|nr:hypothetical protein [Actinophytocola oryzae]TDV40467.1 hypothetical protein CLV71_123178 [Actinophytocola oryzae]
MTVRYIGPVELGKALGVSQFAVPRWLARFPGGSGHPFPEPDIEIDGTPGWRPNRLAEVKEWRERLHATAGSRPTATRQEYLLVAAGHGFDRDEALRTLDTFGEEFPEMTEPEVCAWMIKKWTD